MTFDEALERTRDNVTSDAWRTASILVHYAKEAPAVITARADGGVKIAFADGRRASISASGSARYEGWAETPHIVILEAVLEDSEAEPKPKPKPKPKAKKGAKK